jgi:NADP-dependent 3-hydroxy acid dehydrogenase YdfG
MTSDLRRGVAIVTGASQGIGAAISLALADAGMTVWMVARTADALERAAAHVGPGARPFAADLTDPVARAALVDAVAAEHRALDVLVHNAGIIHLGRIDEASEDEFREQVEVNVLAPYALTRSCLAQLRESQGQIVFINSSAGKTANPGVGQFSATQHAVRAIADSLRAEVNADGVRVTVIHPGRTASPRQATIHAIENRPYAPERLMQPSDVAAVVLAALCLPRTAEVTEIAIRPMLKS